MALVRGYRLFFKAWIGSACRFEPSCSAYALQALERHGAAQGGWLTAARLLRCHPYCDGGCDPVPENFTNPAAGLFTRLGLSQAEVPTPGHTPRPPIRNRP
jgi:putative membrane protein insertion efficiency factor